MIEPGEAVALDAGILVGEILDLFDNGVAIGITDISATCHMPDVIEAPYRPAMLGEEAGGPVTRLGGPSCLAGDVIGDYRLPGEARVGQRFAFLDQERSEEQTSELQSLMGISEAALRLQ